MYVVIQGASRLCHIRMNIITSSAKLRNEHPVDDFSSPRFLRVCHEVVPSVSQVSSKFRDMLSVQMKDTVMW